MEEQQKTAAAGTSPGAEKDVMVTGREINKVPAPKHGNPTEAAPPAVGETVLGVRVGSEAAVESGTGPVLPVAGAGSEYTRVRNKDLREKDEKEFKKRGLRQDSRGNVPPRSVSATFEGLMRVHAGEDDKEGTLVSGSYTGYVPPEGLLIRPLSPEEEAEMSGGLGRHQARRADDLARGSGAGGGGNPMKAGEARGVSDPSREGGQGKATTSVGQGVGTGGTTSRTQK